MSHLPKNHPLRPLYRFLAAAAGIYCLVFGVVGIVRTGNAGLFSQKPQWALGLKTNLAFSILSVVIGAIVLGVTVIGRNIDQMSNVVLGPIFIVVGLAMLLLLRTNANVLNFGMSTCVVSFVIGLVLFAESLYTEVASEERANAEETFRRNAPDPETTLRHP